MTREQLVARSIIAWLNHVLRRSIDAAREALPQMDVEYFLREISVLPEFSDTSFSIALVGFGVTETRLRELSESSGLRLRAVTDDLHVAAAWRNNRANHPRILAFARGVHPGVSTLRHFDEPRSYDLARAVLHWAKDNPHFCANTAQQLLLETLSADSLRTVISLESATRFLEAWSLLQEGGLDNSPQRALPYLGLLSDPDLLVQTERVEERLTKNLETTRMVIDASAHQVRALRRNLLRRIKNDDLTRQRLLDVVDRIEAMRLRATFDQLSRLSVADVWEVWRPPADIVEPVLLEESEESHTDENPTNSSQGSVNISEVATYAGNALLNDSQEVLEQLIDDLELNLQEALDSIEGEPSGQVHIAGDSFDLELKVDRKFLDWLHTFCSDSSWGGLIETEHMELSKGLPHYESSTYTLIYPSEIAVLEGRKLSIEQLLTIWDSDLSKRGHKTNLIELWNLFGKLRSEILADIDTLVHFPLNWLAGRPIMSGIVSHYLDTASKLYHQVQQHFRIMADIDEGWARAALEGLLALDVVQVRTQLEDGRSSFKAVLLPTHPLHLWRYQRLVSVLRGLGSSLADQDRQAVLNECRRPEQFLSVLYASPFPAGRGGARLLPISNEIYGLATFENLQNAFTGLDGLETIRYALDRFSVMHRNHTAPLRVAIVNPPQATALIAQLSKILVSRRVSTVNKLRLELFSTEAPSVRTRAAKAMEFSGKEQEVIEDRLTSGSLELQVHEKPLAMNALAEYVAARPFHIVVVFDEAGVSITRSRAGELPLPMSPFCVRKVIQFQEHRNILRLVPSADDPPFIEFMQLMNEAEAGQRDSTPQTWADAEKLREFIDKFLQGKSPGATWLVFVDRALPSESSLSSVRLLMRREGQRSALVLAGNYRRLAHRVRPAFTDCNLQVSSSQLELLLEEGVNLVGAGLLDLIKVDGAPNISRVLGLAGMLLAARDYRYRHPESLVVSVDDALARLWLRLGKFGDRCDLIGLRREDTQFVIEALEVKTTSRSPSGSEASLISAAQHQVEATLEAVTQGLPAAQNEGPLSAPRCEMLKEVFVRGCLSRSVPADLRSQWSQWLKQLFHQEGEFIPCQLRGEVIRVAIGSSKKSEIRQLVDRKFPINLRFLNEGDVHRLLERSTSMALQHRTQETQQEAEPLPEVDVKSNLLGMRDSAITPSEPAMPRQVASSDPLPQVFQDTTHDSEIEAFCWPPNVNEFGMVGQSEVVRQLLNQITFSRDFSQRFPDKLFVGSAGVGKSSFARAIAERLISEPPIQFNGADLQRPRMLIERLQNARKIPARPRGRIRISTCVLFIDEVHAIHSSVATALLGALDDARITTVDNVEYNFSDVVLLMATTDQGRLSEAFRSRPGRVLLQNYTLDEMAGVLWKHGKDALDGFELPREVCLEVAARLRCRPREVVRTLTEHLLQHFYSLGRSIGDISDKRAIGELMTHASVVEFFESQKIDQNGIDPLGKNYLSYLNRNGATAEERLRQALGIPNRNDFIEIDEYLQRLGLVTIQGGRTLTSLGRRYIQTGPINLRTRIARQIS